MVRGIERFRQHFKGYEDNYALIGGAACDLAMTAIGGSFRATKDLDIVLCLESLASEFIDAFWTFIRDGGYQTQQKSTGRRLFYRFHSPTDETYPYMLELFSRVPDALSVRHDGHLTPIPTDIEASSLSAILLDEFYYHFLLSGKTEIDGITVVKPEYILPLKVRAWLDLTERKATGEQVDSRDTRKHCNDIFRLFLILTPADIPGLTGQVAQDLRSFLALMAEKSMQMKAFGYPANSELRHVLHQIEEAYGVDA